MSDLRKEIERLRAAQAIDADLLKGRAAEIANLRGVIKILEQSFAEVCEALECEPDNEQALLRVSQFYDSLGRKQDEVERLRAALEAVKADEYACHSDEVWKQVEEALA